MTTVIEAVLVISLLGCLAAVGWLLLVVRHQLRQISDLVDQRLRKTDPRAPDEEPAVGGTPEVAARPTPQSPKSAPAEPVAEPIAVITAFVPERDDDIDESAARIASVTLAEPLIKVVAFSHGIRHALGNEQRTRIRYAVRRELRRQKKLRRRSRAHLRRSSGQSAGSIFGRSEGMT